MEELRTWTFYLFIFIWATLPQRKSQLMVFYNATRYILMYLVLRFFFCYNRTKDDVKCLKVTSERYCARYMTNGIDETWWWRPNKVLNLRITSFIIRNKYYSWLILSSIFSHQLLPSNQCLKYSSPYLNKFALNFKIPIRWV